jgi:hypothetical protein
MQTKTIITTVIVTALIVLISGASLALGERTVIRLGTNVQTSTDEDADAARKTKFPCLPKEVNQDQIVSYGRGGKHVTVADKLREIKAKCRNGKLVDAKRREIRFFHVACWGNPPPDYREIKQREAEELRKLQQQYTVITFGCNPLMP